MNKDSDFYVMLRCTEPLFRGSNLAVTTFAIGGTIMRLIIGDPNPLVRPVQEDPILEIRCADSPSPVISVDGVKYRVGCEIAPVLYPINQSKN